MRLSVLIGCLTCAAACLLLPAAAHAAGCAINDGAAFANSWRVTITS